MATNENRLGKATIRSANFVTTFLWWCSGVIVEIVRDTPSDHVKYQAIGASVLATGFFAFLSGGYALYQTFNNSTIGVLMGLVWGLLIFNLTRFTVSSIRFRADENARHVPLILQKLLSSLPLILLSIVIGIIISKPLEIRLFSAEIEYKLVGYRQAATTQLDVEIAKTEDHISTLEYKMDAKDEEVQRLRDLYVTEVQGLQGGSKAIGHGPVAKQLLSRYREAAEEREKLTKDTQEIILQEKARLSDLKARRSEYAASLSFGMLGRIQALSELTKQNSAIARVDIAITALILFMSLAPILMKLLSPPGAYDIALEQEERKLLERDRLVIQQAYSDALDRSAFNPLRK